MFRWEPSPEETLTERKNVGLAVHLDQHPFSIKRAHLMQRCCDFIYEDDNEH